MPSRQLATSSPHRNRHHAVTPLLASTASACSFIFLLLLCLRKRKRTTPSSDSDSNLPIPFSYALLRRATNSFSTRLGHGGFGTVFSGSLPPAGKPVAVKLMDSASLQGEREFHNELFFASRLRSDLVVPAIGFSSDPERRRFLLVYDLMHNGNLHDALLRSKCPELMQWKNRFAIVLDIARGIQYLHSLDPGVIHGDIKPSNILLDRCFSARIGDFGLARLKTESQFEVESEKKRKEELENDGVSVVEETESVNTGFEEQSCDGVGEIDMVKTKEVDVASPVNGRVKDYVMDWIGKEVKKETPKGEWVVGAASSSGTAKKKKSGKKLEWWESMDEENDASGVLKEKRRPARKWWKEEYTNELAKKTKKKKQQQRKRNGGNSDDDNDDDWWERDDGLYSDINKSNKNRNRSVDSLFSGELRRAVRREEE